MTRRNLRARMRNGVAVTELAIMLPLLILLALVPIELCTMLHIRESAEVCSYEAARIVTRTEGDESAATARCMEILSERNISGGSISYSPGNTSNLEPGTQVTATVEVPFDENSIFGLWFQSKTVSSFTVMMKE